MIGTALGPYEILDTLGAGGMGQVYLARDTRLGRNVAVKVLPIEFASIPERLARFEQEARAAAALNHPHIAAVFDVGRETVEGESGEVHYMVQEHLKGQTLAERLASKGAMPTKAALALAVEVVEALTAAHGARIVHRDLKPANIFLSEDGHGKILDFGLAKLTEFTGVGGSADSRSPTMVGTVAGQVMGTAGYMAPEQVEGESIDHRADLFAFGCVLYEMITGRRAFSGKNVLDTLHKIANSDPAPLAEASSSIPADLERILKKCLAKDRGARYQTASDLLVDLRSLVADVDQGTALPLGAVAAPAVTPSTRWVVVALAAGIAIGALAMWLLRGHEPAEVTRFEVTLPEGFVLGRGVAVSSDGREVVFSATDPDGRAGLFRRRLHELTPSFITGSDGGELPVYSPDGEWIVFSASEGLTRIPAEGGEPLMLYSLGSNVYASWAPDDTIVFEARGAIYRVGSAGGTPEVLVDAKNAPRYDTPFALPDGRHVLIGVRENDWSVSVLDADTGTIRKLVDNAVDPGYLETGYLTFARGGALWAQPFDADALELRGTPFPLQSGVWVSRDKSMHAVARDGTFIYLPGTGREDESLVWLDPEGAITEESAPAPGAIHAPRLSPDEELIAMTIAGAEGGTQVYTYDRRRKTFSLLRSLEEGAGERPVWSPDGKWIYYAGESEGDLDIYRAPVDRSAAPERVLERPSRQRPADISPDGTHLLFEEFGGSGDVWSAPLDGGEPAPFLAETHIESQPTFSPDGRWVAYASTASGGSEVYCTPFPGPGPIFQVSSDGGNNPVWAKDGSRLYYAWAPGDLFEAIVVPGSDLTFGAPRRVARGAIPNPARWGQSFDSAGDGRLLLSNSALGRGNAAERPTLVVVLNWLAEVERLAPKR